MKLNLIGFGCCLAQEAIEGNYPYKDYLPKSLQRMSSRMARMVYIAASRALKDAGIEQCGKMPIDAGTGMSEIDAGIELIHQILETGGSAVSPTLVQNSVTNAPFSLLSIGIKDTSPVITLSHSFLSAYSAIEMAAGFMKNPVYETVMVIAGDQYLEKWAEILKENPISEKINQENLKEGICALIFSKEQKYSSCVEVLNSGLYCLTDKNQGLKDILLKNQIQVSPQAQVFIQSTCQEGLESLSAIASLLGVSEKQISFTENSLASPLVDILNLLEKKRKGEFLFIGSEFDDVGILQVHIK